jgi:hypothetical protein
MIFARLIMIVVVLVPLSASANARDAATEIEYLLTSVGSSDCKFIRNGDPHNADDAEEHLRMKYKRGKRYVSTSETFIERLASGSSLSRKPYYIECTGNEPVRSGDWLTQRLRDFRKADETTQPH